MKRNKKGFTIVELVIVIAVVAILSAILIPTFSSLIVKANLSADQVAVKNMNTALEIYEIESGKPKDLADVRQALDESGFNSQKNMIPVSKGYSFLWNAEDNAIMLIDDATKTVVYPEKYKGKAVDRLKSFDISYPAAQVDITGAKTVSTGDGNIDLDCSFVFVGNPEDAATSEYKDWAVDFVVYFDQDVTVTAAGQTYLAGQYDQHDENWVPLDIFYLDEENRNGSNNAVTIKKEKEINLLQDVVIGILYPQYEGWENIIWDYEGICNPDVVGTFNCGAFDNGTNAGTKMTVELRLYEVITRDEGNTRYYDRNTDNYIVVYVYEYVF